MILISSGFECDIQMDCFLGPENREANFLAWVRVGHALGEVGEIVNRLGSECDEEIARFDTADGSGSVGGCAADEDADVGIFGSEIGNDAEHRSAADLGCGNVLL